LDADGVLPESGDTLRSLRKLEVVQNVPASQRTVELMLLEFDLKAASQNPTKVFEICRQHQSEFSAERLSKDGCKHLFPWYLAWYIFEIDFETSKKLGRSASELQPIVDGWHDLMIATPSPGKKEETNIVYLKDLLVVDDRLGDVLRELGQFAKAKQVYEANWLRSESVRAFYKFDEKVWYVSEQAISSLLVLAEKDGKEVLKLSPKDPDANALHDAIKDLMTQE
jgi:hypothetical protein